MSAFHFPEEFLWSTATAAHQVAYFQRALASLAGCMQAGVDVRGYMCLSALDNFEWVGGFRPKFGIIDVDRATQARTPKPSARWLGDVARTGKL